MAEKVENVESVKEKSPIPHIENYIHPINAENLESIQEFLGLVLKNYEKKLEQSKEHNLIIKNKNVEIKNKEISSLFNAKESISDIAENEKYESIFDCINFYHYITDNSEKIEKKEIDINILDKLYNKHLSEKGVLLLLCDYQFLCQLCEKFKKLLGDKYSIKIFIKVYLINKLPFMGVFSIQKLYKAKEPYDIENEKMLSYELNKIEDKYTFSKPISYTFGQLAKSITYINEIYQYQAYLYKLHPGSIIPIKIKETLYSDDIAFTISVCDSNDENLIKLNKCAAIIISKNFANEFITLTAEGNMSLCKQCNVSRLLLIRPAPFNFDPINIIKEKYPLIYLFLNLEVALMNLYLLC